MAQADYIISNQTFPNTRADINSHLQAIATNNSGTSAPTTQYAGQFWIDTTSSNWVLYIHDGADDIQFATIDTSANTVNFIDSELGDNSVTTSKIADGNVTSAKLSYPLTTFSSTGIDDNATSTAITIDSSERVGIGETSMDALLVIKGNSDESTTPSIRLKDGSDSREAWITNTAGDLILTTGGNDNVPHTQLRMLNGNLMTFKTSNTERMRIDSSGRVGIGTSSPSSTLSVGSTSYSQASSIGQINGANKVITNNAGILNIGSTDSASADIGGSLGFTANGGINGYPTGQISGRRESATSSDYSSYLAFTTSNSGGTVSERMRINSSGQVGIGTTSPGFPLEISSSAQTTLLHLNSTAGTTSAITFANTGSNDSITVGAENDDLKLRTDDGVIKFFTNENSEKMRIDSSGGLGVGDTPFATTRLTLKAPSSGNQYMVYGKNGAGTNTLIIAGDGSITNFYGSYGTISDENLKQDIVNANSQWNDIKSLQIKNYKLKSDVELNPETAPNLLGVIAQDLESLNMNGLVKTDEDGTKSVKYSVLYMKAVKALQEAMERIETLEAEVTALKNQP